MESAGSRHLPQPALSLGWENQWMGGKWDLLPKSHPMDSGAMVLSSQREPEMS